MDNPKQLEMDLINDDQIIDAAICLMIGNKLLNLMDDEISKWEEEDDQIQI